MNNTRIKKKIIPEKLLREIVELCSAHDGRGKIPTTIEARDVCFI